jgi:hypothetical protein
MEIRPTKKQIVKNKSEVGGVHRQAGSQHKAESHFTNVYIAKIISLALACINIHEHERTHTHMRALQVALVEVTRCTLRTGSWQYAFCILPAAFLLRCFCI